MSAGVHALKALADTASPAEQTGAPSLSASMKK
jgi:hypothetical protein